MGRPPRARGLAAFAFACALGVPLAWAPGCAGSIVRVGADRLAYPRLGGSIQDPASYGLGFERIDVEGATLAFRNPDRAYLAWVRECRGPRKPQRLAAALLSDWRATPRRQESRTVAGAPGWWMHAEAAGVELVAITRADAECSDDWLLVTRGPAARLEPVLERWVASFDPSVPTREGARAGPRRE